MARLLRLLLWRRKTLQGDSNQSQLRHPRLPARALGKKQRNNHRIRQGGLLSNPSSPVARAAGKMAVETRTRHNRLQGGLSRNLSRCLRGAAQNRTRTSPNADLLLSPWKQVRPVVDGGNSHHLTMPLLCQQTIRRRRPNETSLLNSWTPPPDPAKHQTRTPASRIASKQTQYQGM